MVLVQMRLALIFLAATSASLANGAVEIEVTDVDVMTVLSALPTCGELSSQPDSEVPDDLLGIFADADSSVCGSIVKTYSISQQHCIELATREIVRRKPINELSNALREESYQTGRLMAAYELLNQFSGADVESRFHQLAWKHEFTPGTYLSLMHFAKRCESWALMRLNNHWEDFPVPSHVWADAVSQFGKCKYYPATTHLMDGLNFASLNVAAAAEQSLLQLYPDGPRANESMPDAMTWKRWLRARRK